MLDMVITPNPGITFDYLATKSNRGDESETLGLALTYSSANQKLTRRKILQIDECDEEQTPGSFSFFLIHLELIFPAGVIIFKDVLPPSFCVRMPNLLFSPEQEFWGKTKKIRTKKRATTILEQQRGRATGWRGGRV